MKTLLLIVLSATAPAIAQNYTFTAPHLTMHAGDLVPPCPIIAIDQSTGDSVGEGNNLFTGNTHDTCTPGATSTSPVGTYTTTLTPGNLVPRSGGTITRVNGSIDVIAADANGAGLSDNVPYPSGIFSGPLFPMINVTSNKICNMVGDNGVTDNTPCLQNLLTYGGLRAKAGAIVNTSGTTVTESGALNTSMNFTTIPTGTSVIINGSTYTVASIISSTSLSLTSTIGTNTGVLFSVPTAVNTSGTTVTSTNGVSFTGLAVPSNILINGIVYVIASVTDSTHLVTKTALPTLTGAPFYIGNYASNGFNRSPLTLYFPTGIYWIHGSVQVFDDYWTLTGDGPQNSIIRLAPNSAQFSGGTTLVPMINVASIGGNDNFSEIIQNLQIRVGQGNPNAAAIEWPNNNEGEIRNVEVWSEDSIASTGIYAGEAYSGATLLKGLGVYGFQTGIAATSPSNEYSLTADQITLEGQQTQGIYGNMVTSFQHVLSDNSVPALVSTSSGRGVLIDSSLLSQNAAATGITIANKNQLYFRNVSCAGYGTCESDDGTGTVVTRMTLPAEGWTGTAQTIFDTSSTPAALSIPDTETPIASDPAVSTWTMLGTDPQTWCSTILGSSSTTVYLPPGTYTASTQKSVPCTIPDTINHLVLWSGKFSVTSLSLLLNLTVAGTSTTPLVIDGCIQSACNVSHTGARTVVLSNATIGYTAEAGAGNVYFEDVQTSTSVGNNAAPGPTFFAGQLVTGRQLDIETGATGSGTDQTMYPKIECQGASVWILGYKTEKNSPSLIGTAGCQANIFGFFFYNLETAPAGSAPFVLTDSSLFATGFNDWNVAANGSPYWVSETRSGVTEYLTMPAGSGSGEALNMFYSFGAAPPPH